MHEIHEIDTLEDYLDRDRDLRGCVIQGLDLGELHRDWSRVQVEGAIFLGCRFQDDGQEVSLMRRGALIFPRFDHLPYRPYRPALYTREELNDGWVSEAEDGSLDRRIYDHFVNSGRSNPDVYEALAQRLHDHAIDDALTDLLEGRSDGSGEPRKVVAIMGGHGTSRLDPWFRKVAQITRRLARDGYFIASGGGPGIMEAANLGAWMASEENETALDDAIEMLSDAPIYTSPGYVAAAAAVVEKYSQGSPSLAIPTWFYGHEPSNQFSTHIAKYFSNSIREDGLLAIAKYGVIYAPGSAGTNQEIFMDATQNHYATFDYISPMVFLSRAHYEEKTGLFPTLERLAEGKPWGELLHLTDEVGVAVEFISEYELIKG